MGKAIHETPAESRLSQSEVGLCASSLILDYKRSIQRIPEFAAALEEVYFSESPRRGLDDPIDFKKGEYRYLIHYTVDDQREELRVAKLPKYPDRVDWTSENITLEVIRDKRTHKPTGGAIQSAVFYKDGEPHEFTNTQAAIEKVVQFNKKNFYF